MLRKTYLRYPGGKSKYVNKMFPYFPEFEEYRETMVGGGGIFLFLKKKFPTKRFWINDKYYNLYLFWLMARDKNDDLVRELLRIKEYTNPENSAKYALEFKSKINDASEFNRAVYFYYINKVSFSGLTESGGISPIGWEKNFSLSCINALRELKDILWDVNITNLDYKEVLDFPGKDVFIYLDPPYDIEASVLYGHKGEGHKTFDHIRFYGDILNCKHKFLISYNDSEILRERYKDYNINTLEFNYTMVTKAKKTELLIDNFSDGRQIETNIQPGVFGQPVRDLQHSER